MIAALDSYARLGLEAFMPAVEQRERLKGKLAALIGCDSADLALNASTTAGLLDLSSCIPMTPDDRILCFDGEFPANVTPWQQCARVELLRQQDLDDDAVLAEVERALRVGGVRLIAVSAVQFATGRVMPIGGITALAHAHGAEVVVDAIQGLGVMPFDVRALGVDYLAAGAHKWLMGLEGVGFVYVAPSRVRSLVPRVAGWLSHEDPVGFLFEGPNLLRYDRAIRRSTDFMEGHSLNAIGCFGLEASLDLIQELGVPAIQAHVRTYLDALEVGMVGRGFTSLRRPGSVSGTLSLLPPQGQSCVAWAAYLQTKGVSMSGPDGKLRFAPHWPNHHDEVPVVLDLVDAR
jgi:cysteine desulfurase/selenocysteine lyase